MYEKELDINVIDAAERRVLETFNKNKFVSMSFSGGKDSICMADVLVKTMQKYNIEFSRLVVIFFDEEAIYPDVESVTLEWRSKFLSLGAKFYWFCLPIKHFNCCNQLENDESFICWEPGKEDIWVRQMPKFAIRNHSAFVMGMSYQVFGEKIFKNIPQMVGLRMAESIQRRSSISSMRKSTFVYPLYDWKDSDIWLYIQHQNLQIPETYIYLYKVGVVKNRLRISQFFSIDTIKSLPKVLEFYPDLYEKILKREPNADLAMLYNDTDMFRSSRQNQVFGLEEGKSYRKELHKVMLEAGRDAKSYPGYKDAKKLYSKLTEKHTERTFKKIYLLLVAGDPKKRTYRAILSDLKSDIEQWEEKNNGRDQSTKENKER